MEQTDWVGLPPSRKPFKDIRNTRDSTAEEKAKLALTLGEMCNRCPQVIKNGGSVNQVRHWKTDREASMKVAGNKRASVHELTAAINTMRKWA